MCQVREVTLNMDRQDFIPQAPHFPSLLAEGAAGKRGKLVASFQCGT